MKNIIYIIPFLFLFSCSYIDEKQVIQSKTEETNIDSFLGLSDSNTGSGNNEDLNDIENLANINTGEIGEEILEKTVPSDISNNLDIDETGDGISEDKIENIDTQIVEVELVEIENIKIEVDDIVTEQTDEEATIIEESTDEDIEELIDILFETSS